MIALPTKFIIATFVISSSLSGNVAWNTHLSSSGSDRAATYFPDQKLEEVRRNARYSGNISFYGVIVCITGYAQCLMPRANQGEHRVYQVNEFSYVERLSRSIVSYASEDLRIFVFSEAEVVADAVSRAANTPRTIREVIVAAAAIAVTGSLFIAT